MKGKYKKYDKGGSTKGRKSKRQEQLRRMNELALAAKLMFLEGYASEENPVAAPIEAYLPSNLMRMEDNPEGDAVYNMLQYPWDDKVVIGKRVGYPDYDPRNDYSMGLPMDMVRAAQFPLPSRPPMKEAKIPLHQPTLKLMK